MARRRPNAFEVSFPEEAPYVNPNTTSLRALAASDARVSSTSLKRKSDTLEPYGGREPKRIQLPPPQSYKSRGGGVESKDLIIIGEDPFDREDPEAGDGEGQPNKPIRLLSDFVIYDPKHANEMVSLSEEAASVDRVFECEGFVFPYSLTEEDAGQEDDDDDEVGQRGKMVKLGSILNYAFDYTQTNDPPCIETEFAWYILEVPSPDYQPFFQHFYTPRRITQMVISTALQHKQKSYDEFMRHFKSTVDIFGRTYKEDDLWDSLFEIREGIDEYNNRDTLKNTVLIQHILRKLAPILAQCPASTRRNTPRRRKPPLFTSLAGNLDITVLKPENLVPTHVTPFIASMAQGRVFEELVVLGSKPPPENQAAKQAQKDANYRRLCRLIEKASRVPTRRPRVDLRREDFVGSTQRYCRSVQVEGVQYEAGDFVLIPMQFRTSDRGFYEPPIQFLDLKIVNPNSTIADFFWFGKILYGDMEAQPPAFHIQWLQHSSQTIMKEFGHPQELVQNDLCDHVPFGAIIDKITVHTGPNPPKNADEFFLKFVYSIRLAAFTSIDTTCTETAAQSVAPDNCPICPFIEQQNQDRWDCQLKNEQGLVNGVTYGGQCFHYEDFVLHRAKQGPANIGYITGFAFKDPIKSQIRTEVHILRVGRVSALNGILPDDVIRHERHVFLTEEKATVPLTDLVSVCHVISPQSVQPKLEKWLAMSPLHYYVLFTFPSTTVRSWSQRKTLSCADLAVCQSCTKTRVDHFKETEEFLANMERHPLRALDLFGGVGTFSWGLSQGSGCLNVTDLVEISPSAASTVKRNFPSITVHNQCANEVLRYTIKLKSNQNPQQLKQIYDETTILPSLEPPDVIVAGAPCQTHSRLNRFKKANDIKSNLILTALSYVDYFKPSLFYFENVPGFLEFRFDAIQSSSHNVQGGIPMGGLKFVVSALVAMNYQVRFGYLQAGHYGTPQRRKRFFLIAATDGHPLPELPQPSHDFPDNGGLQINLPNGDVIRPFRTIHGTAPHPFISIEDAISDLPRFDWEHPRFYHLSAARQLDLNKRKWSIKSLPCKYKSTHCGISGQTFQYHHSVKTFFQQVVRAKPTHDIQHFTRTFHSRKVERVVSIPMRPGADYRDLRPDQQEWQLAHPLSSVAQANYRPGLYGRLDEKKFFPTTVTNMDTTAKQSWVLNPYCHRMVTVRELARSQGFPDHFVFEAFRGNVVTMHRQIGNAVPLPVGIALGRELRNACFKKWLNNRQEPIQDE